MKKKLLIALGVLAGLVLIGYVIGATRPANHTASHSAQFAVAPDSVWKIIADIEAQPHWVPMVRSVERLPDNAGRPAYRENFDGFEVMTVVTESAPPARMVKEILPTGPFYGTWTWELAPAGGGTRLTITERGTVPNPLFRVMMMFGDPTESIRQYLAALGPRLNAAVTGL